MTTVHTTTPVLTHLAAFFARFSFSGLSHRTGRCEDLDHNVSREEPTRERLDCGAYNEAFIVQSWASYNPRY